MRKPVGMKRVGGFERGRTWWLSGDGDDGQLDGGPFTEVGGMERRAERTKGPGKAPSMLGCVKWDAPEDETISRAGEGSVLMVLSWVMLTYLKCKLWERCHLGGDPRPCPCSNPQWMV